MALGKYTFSKGCEINIDMIISEYMDVRRKGEHSIQSR